MRVGFIGLGSQGGPMARRIAEAGYPTTLWARRPVSVEPFSDTAAAVADSPAALAATSDLVGICVVGDADVREVVTGEQGVLAGLAPGSILAIHSTVHPDTCRELAELAGVQGVSVIDAPVSGGGQAAAEQRLLVMVGGPDDVVERARPVFATYADPIVHLGEVGSGQMAKLLNNVLFTANLATAQGTLRLGTELGVAPERLGEVITHGTANSFALGRIVSAGGTLDRLAQHAGDLLRKDVGLIAELAASAGVTPGIELDAADATLALMNRRR
ncbi:NAD(P)-dependent oxidoreductase [Skermania piniformis]|uniref:NAD(P)-dependent oxidoreductase n=1 Tax=Skermania pinensis TaxID=39122 RepID=A0ABX8SFX3_9ACTN|nr:NAD(P)-dependent oxidoreductase [Skermania piniformis]QXQ15330.1 NAD(P)-dependent oxidoreductase [Skermania piniformis]